MPVNIFVGDCTEDLAIHAKNLDPVAYLIDRSNYKYFLQQQNIDVTVYTSFADLPKISKTECVFYKVLNKADQIFYCPPAVWSDHTNEFSIQNMQQITEYFLYLLQIEKNNVVSLDLSKYKNHPYLNLSDCRQSGNTKQLWIAGCSITAGVGVCQEERWPVLVAKNFGEKFVDLSKSGSSLEFAADQILRSDIRSGDFVVWGLTSEYRASVWDRKNQQCISINPYGFEYVKTNQADDIVDETRLYKAVTAFAQVENYCNKIGANLIGVPMICSEALQLLLHDHHCYYQLPYRVSFLDFGTDKVHPGRAQHRYYAEHVNKILKDGFNIAT